jgi:hypothetical protein
MTIDPRTLILIPVARNADYRLLRTFSFGTAQNKVTAMKRFFLILGFVLCASSAQANGWIAILKLRKSSW